MGHFLRLLRWPNLVFIAITQVLFHFCVVLPAANGQTTSFPLQLQLQYFWMLCGASMLIAGAGYIINDYFDINIDQVNKPDKMVVEKIITRRAAIFWHWLFSGIGIAISAYISFKLRNPILFIGNCACVLLLWVYSTTYKRRLIIGNVLISLMTAWVVLVLLIAEVPGWFIGSSYLEIERASAARLSRIGVLYASFAFVLSLVREVVKDMEDMEGDRKEHCRTLPIVFGVNAAKVFAGTWLFILVAMLLIMEVYVLLFGWWYFALYITILVVIPLVYLFKKLFDANDIKAYHTISSQIKWVMLTGIFSMLFFLLYTR